ncbi:MAG: hypothetical protein ACHQ6U_13530 [Thermodesulfobacteriota bacterium]
MHEAEQDYPVRKETVYDISVKDGLYEVLCNGAVSCSSDDLSRTIFNLQWLIHSEALSGITDRIRIHAGCGEWDGRRFLVVGDKGVGKTTLMVSLLQSGFRIIGDELVLIREGKAIPFPRRFHIKEGSTHLLPKMKPLFESLPYNITYYGHKMYSLAPQDLGYDWKIDEGKIRAVFYLVPNHGAESRIEACPKFMMVNRVMPMSFLSETVDHLKISRLCGMIDNADCYILYVGDLKGAVSALREELSVI